MVFVPKMPIVQTPWDRTNVTVIAVTMAMDKFVQVSMPDFMEQNCTWNNMNMHEHFV